MTGESTADRASVHRPTAEPPVLRVRGLRVAYGTVPAVEDLSLALAPGRAITILGANGAGKSSALRAIAGLQRPKAGEIWLEGTRIDGWSTDRIARRGLSLVPGTRDLFPRFSVAEHLRIGAHMRRGQDFANRRAEVLGLFPALERHLHHPAHALSGGEQQMLALATALLGQPRVLLLDEPSVGLAPLAVQAIFEALAHVIEAGTAVLLVEQTTVAALRLAQYAYVLRNGRVALEGPCESLRRDPRVRDLYLGTGADVATYGPGDSQPVAAEDDSEAAQAEPLDARHHPLTTES